jgi:hypothetical protein
MALKEAADVEKIAKEEKAKLGSEESEEELQKKYRE